MPVQLQLPGLDAAVGATDRILFAVVPDVNQVGVIDQLARRLRAEHELSGKPLAVDRFHVTLHHLGDYVGLPRDIVAKATETGEATKAPPFEAEFDRAGSFARKGGKSPLVLLGGAGVAGLIELQQTVGVAMASAGLAKRVASNFVPHLTLLYDRQIVDEHPVEPIGWTVREFVLIHSLLGQTKHIVLGRWPLRA